MNVKYVLRTQAFNPNIVFFGLRSIFQEYSFTVDVIKKLITLVYFLHVWSRHILAPHINRNHCESINKKI